MATSRIVPTNDNVSTYDSGGGKDYTALATWEAATDINLVTATQSESLEVYAGAHDDEDTLDGATTSSSYWRCVRGASTDRHAGIPKIDGTVAAFVYDASVDMQVGEDYSGFQDLVIKHTANTTSYRYVLMGVNNTTDYSEFIGILAVDSLNSGTGGISGLLVYQHDSACINCLVHNIETHGFYCFVYNTSGSDQVFIYNCTADSNGGTGFYQHWNGDVLCKNCVATNNSTDFDADVTQTTCSTSATYVASGSDDFHLDSSDTNCKDQGTDLSADSDFAFDDDIDFTTRSGTWDIGFDEYVVTDIIGSGAGTLTPAGASSRDLRANRSYGGVL